MSLYKIVSIGLDAIPWKANLISMLVVPWFQNLRETLWISVPLW
jgi:hypothetical protein